MNRPALPRLSPPAFARPLLSAVTVWGLLLLPTGRAEAYCRATTCGEDTDDYCAVGDNGCVIDGLPLAWPLGSRVLLGLDQASAKEFGAVDAADAVAAATDAWAEVRCGGEEPSIDVSVAPSGDPADIIVEFIDQDWPYEEDAVGRTELVFGAKTGWLERATIFLNTEGYSLALQPQGDEVDVVAVLTHELGHVLALDHTPVEGATMEAEAKSGWAGELRSLEDDDQEGLCALYPAATETVVFDLGAGGEVLSADEEPGEDAGGCSSSPGHPGNRSWVFALAVCGAGVVLARRRFPGGWQ